jgi:transglutaminase-like putative cysteine protease
VTRIEVRTELVYDVAVPTSFSFALLAAENDRQRVDERQLVISQGSVRRDRFDPSGHVLLRVVAEPGPLTLVYDAVVTMQAHVPDEVPRVEVPFDDLPADVLGYLHPSRYCQSDLVSRLAGQTFGGLEPGFERVAGICNWIWERLTYLPGSTDASTTAVDVLVSLAGVCRDYAHVAITFCRALGIPARYLSGYAVDLAPPDFHGFFEAYLDGDWYLFDATRMAPIDRLMRIAAGRDAADVAFAAIVGDAMLTSKEVSVVDLDVAGRAGGTAAAVATA